MGNSLVVAAHSVLMNLGLLTHWCSTLCLALATKGLPVIQHMLSATAPFKGFAYNCPPLSWNHLLVELWLQLLILLLPLFGK